MCKDYTSPETASFIVGRLALASNFSFITPYALAEQSHRNVAKMALIITRLLFKKPIVYNTTQRCRLLKTFLKSLTVEGGMFAAG